MNVNCDYCQKPAELKTGEFLYPHRPDLFHLRFWVCEPCEAYVGCHKNSRKHVPLGRLANASLRIRKQMAHEFFDKIWKSREMGRSQAYTYLADRLGIEKKHCHIGMFDEEMCHKVVRICKADEKIKQLSRMGK